MDLVDASQIVLAALAVIAALVATTRWFIHRRHEREEDELLLSLRKLWADGQGKGFEPKIGSREYRIAERLVRQERLGRIGTVYLEPTIIKVHDLV